VSGNPLLAHPVDFSLRVLRAFQRNQGVLLAGAVAYYLLLSVLPLLILAVIGLSHLFERSEVLVVLARYLEWLIPSQSRAVLGDVEVFLDNSAGIGVVMLGTLLFFGSLAFSVLQKALAVIFAHRHAVVGKRHFAISALLPYLFMAALMIALLVITSLFTTIESIAGDSLKLFGTEFSFSGLPGFFLYFFGLTAEILLMASIYRVMPVGRTRLRHALVGGTVAALLWEIVRHVLRWYFGSLSKASVVYGSLSTAVVALLAMEVAATLLLLGAQVIAEYEQEDRDAA
jgi:YihY family inner membrane protein